MTLANDEPGTSDEVSAGNQKSGSIDNSNLKYGPLDINHSQIAHDKSGILAEFLSSNPVGKSTSQENIFEQEKSSNHSKQLNIGHEQ